MGDNVCKDEHHNQQLLPRAKEWEKFVDHENREQNNNDSGLPRENNFFPTLTFDSIGGQKGGHNLCEGQSTHEHLWG